MEEVSWTLYRNLDTIGAAPLTCGLKRAGTLPKTTETPNLYIPWNKSASKLEKNPTESKLGPFDQVVTLPLSHSAEHRSLKMTDNLSYTGYRNRTESRIRISVISLCWYKQ